MGLADGGWRSSVHASLKTHQPMGVRARVAGEWVDIAMTVGRLRWHRVLAAIPGDCDRVELLDAQGAVQWGIDVDDGAVVGPEPGTPLDAVAIVRLVVDAQDMAVRRYESMHAQLTKNYVDLTAILAQRLGSLEKNIGDVIKATFATAEAAGAASSAAAAHDDGGADDLAKHVVAAAMAKMQAAPPQNGKP